MSKKGREAINRFLTKDLKSDLNKCKVFATQQTIDKVLITLGDCGFTDEQYHQFWEIFQDD